MSVPFHRKKLAKFGAEHKEGLAGLVQLPRTVINDIRWCLLFRSMYSGRVGVGSGLRL